MVTTLGRCGVMTAAAGWMAASAGGMRGTTMLGRCVVTVVGYGCGAAKIVCVLELLW